jgi:hypothetical protein
MREARHLVEGFYFMPEVNSKIELYTGPIEILKESNSVIGKGRILVSFLPYPRVVIEAECSADSFGLVNVIGNQQDLDAVIPSISSKFKIDVVSITGHTNLQIVAIPKSPIISSSGANPLKIVFHILNFPEFFGSEAALVEEDGKMFRKGIATLEADGWQITINASKNLTKLIKSIKATGGYIITHAGMIERKDAKPIRLEKAEDLLTALRYFLSFCRGFSTGPFLPVGLTKTNKKIWEKWLSPPADPWQSTLSWFDHHHGQLLTDVFPGFIRRWNDDKWKESIKVAIYWYVKSNTRSGGIDGSIILAQAALELLAWVRLIEDQTSLSPEGFEKLYAADQLRLLLSSCFIPKHIPQSLPELNKLAKRLNWDGPQAFAEIRNFVVHPGKKQRRLSGHDLPYIEVWKLGLWYIELVLLHLFGHTGIYADRLKGDRWVGEVTSVPWAN